ncbi:MAG TPA: hypothetical protein VMT86_19745 [Bryobacteraceae bacterium]|nr:hypothetical protein [Bryobacteraceae bacterium]
MNLADLRKITVKKNLRIRFTLSNGMECVLNEHGVAKLPSLHSVPAFNLEDELSHAREFLVEPAASGKDKPHVRRYSRDEMAALATGGVSGEAHPEEHDD